MPWSGFRAKKEGPQQGTLFDVRGVPSQPVDSPGMQRRGRRAEMLAAMPESTGVRRDAGVFPDVFETTRNRVSADDSPWFRAAEGANKHHRAALARQLADESTVPPSDLAGLATLRVGSRLDPGVGGEYVDSGVYTADAFPDTGTLVHELGHHVSQHQEGHSIGPGTDIAHLRNGAVISPSEEGRADAYALTHAPESRRGSTYANRVRGIGPTKYGSERADRGHPLDDAEMEYQGIPLPRRLLQPELFSKDV